MDDRYYCYLDSNGTTDTNLQLFSLKKAFTEWEELREEYQNHNENTENLTERLVFIVACLGLSLTQLLGQNVKVTNEKMPGPKALLNIFLDGSNYSEKRKSKLKSDFECFIQYYDDCRHFGRNKDDGKWKRINSLDYTIVESFMNTTLDIWNALIGHSRTSYIEADDIKIILR